jgi:hypothetical protein
VSDLVSSGSASVSASLSASQAQVQLPSSIPLQRGDDAWVSGRAATAITLLCVVLAAAWIVVRKARGGGAKVRLRMPGRRERAWLRVVASQRLSSHSALHVVEYEGRRLLLADSAQGVQCLVDEPYSGASALAGGVDDAP